MKYIVNLNGTIKAHDSETQINQFSVNANKIYVAFDGLNLRDYVSYIAFERADKKTSPLIGMSFTQFSLDDVTYEGASYSFSDAWVTAVAGELKVNVILKRSNTTIYTGKITLFVNESVDNDEQHYIDDVAYNELVARLYQLEQHIPNTYTTKEEVDIIKENLEVEISSKAEINYVDEKLEEIINNVYTKEEVDIIKENLEVELSSKAEINYVDEKIEEIINNNIDLSNYYNKEQVDIIKENLEVEISSKAEINYVDEKVEETRALISNMTSLSMQVVDILPVENISSTTIYLLLKENSGELNIYDEYIYINNRWELIGDTQINLSNVVTTDTDQEINGKKTFNKPIVLIGDDAYGRIYPNVNNAGLLGIENNHFKLAYINDIRIYSILPTLQSGGGLVGGVGSIGNQNYHFLNGYIDNMYAKEFKENNVSLSDKYATKEELEIEVSDKATMNYVDSALEEKANINNVYSKEEINVIKENLEVELSSKAEINYVDNAVNNKVDKTYVDTKVENLEVSISSKAEINYVDDVVSGKVDKTYVDTKIENLEVDLSSKAEINYVDEKVAELVNSSPETLDTLQELASALGNDANFATTVANQIGTKANSSDVYTKQEVNTIKENLEIELSTKAEINYVDSSVEGKANVSDVYTKQEIDTKVENLEVELSSKAEINYVDQKVEEAKSVNHAKTADVASDLSDSILSVSLDKIFDVEDYNFKDTNNPAVKKAIDAEYASRAGEADSATMDSQGNDIAMTYATKEELANVGGGSGGGSVSLYIHHIYADVDNTEEITFHFISKQETPYTMEGLVAYLKEKYPKGIIGLGASYTNNQGMTAGKIFGVGSNQLKWQGISLDSMAEEIGDFTTFTITLAHDPYGSGSEYEDTVIPL